MDIGYDRPLYILPFDHRASFEKGLPASKTDSIDGAQTPVLPNRQACPRATSAALEPVYQRTMQ